MPAAAPEYFLAAIVESSDNAIVGVALDGTILSWNRGAERLYGYTAAEMVGLSIQKLVPPGITFDANLIVKAIRDGESLVQVDTTRLRKDGSLVEVSLNVSPIRNDAGDVIGAASITNDLTQRNRLRQSLALQDQRFRALIEEASDVVLVMDASGALTYVSTAIKATAGYDPVEMTGRIFTIYVHPDDVEMAMQSLRQILSDPTRVERLRLRYRHKDGTWRFGETASRNLLDNPGVEGIVINLRDVTDRMLAEQARQKSDARLATLAEHTSDVVALLGRDGRFEYVSPSVRWVAGFEPNDLIGNPLTDFVHPEDRAGVVEDMAALAARPAELRRAVRRYRHQNGSWRIVEGIARNCIDIPGVAGIVFVFRDVTERRDQEQARRDGDAMLAAVSRSSRDAIVLVDHEGRIAFWNNGAESLYGYSAEQALGQNFTVLIPDEDRTFAREDFDLVRRTGRSTFTDKLQEAAALTRAGMKVPVEMALTPVALHGEINVLLVVRNITERKAAEAEREVHAEAIRRSLVESVQALAATLEARDPYTAGHQSRVAGLCTAIAQALGLSKDRIQGLELAAGVHDIGKISIPGEILNKPGRLSDIEFSLVKTHAQAGFDILKDVHFPWPIAQIVGQHHERLDGSGYPNGLRGDQILLESRILAVADVVESMMQHRPYRAGLGKAPALAEITGGRGTKFDAAVVDACLKLFEEGGYTFCG